MSLRSYGTCPCSGRYEARTVEVRMAGDDEVIVLEDVPQGACPVCGSRVYKTAVLEQLEAIMGGLRSAAPPS